MDRFYIKSHECPYCGNIFRAEQIKGPDDGKKPPCIDCMLNGKEPKNKEIG